MARAPQVHTFKTTAEAYNASQTHDEIHDGDVLVATEEGAVAVMLEAWPTALDEATAGEAFHVLNPDASWDAIPEVGNATRRRDYSASAALAREKAAWLARKAEGEQVAELLAPLPVGAEFTLGAEAGPAYRATYVKEANGLWSQVKGTCQPPHVINLSAAHLGFCVGFRIVKEAL